MTRDSGGEQGQRTVAELLAQHGGGSGGAPRRRRRAAEDEDQQPGHVQPETPGRDVSDTAPQAIIDRVNQQGGDIHETADRPNGTARRSAEAPASEAMPRQQQDSGPVPRPQQASGAYPRPRRASEPGFPQEAPASQGPPARPPQAPPPMPSAGAGPADGGPPSAPVNGNGRPLGRRRPRPGSGAPAQPPPQPPPAQPPAQSPSGQQPPQTREVPPAPGGRTPLSARLDGSAPSAANPAPEAPEQAGPSGPATSGGAALPSRRSRGAAQTNGAPPPDSHTEQFAAVAGEQEPTRNGFPSRPPVEDEPPAGLAGWRQRRRAAQVEDTQAGIPPVAPADPDAEPDAAPARTHVSGAGPPTQGFPAPSPLLDDEADDEDFEDDWYRDRRRHDEFDQGDEDFEDEPSPGRQWLTMAGQLALGVVAGATVWLGFNWLWGQIPAAGLIAALIVIAGLVWIVRKIRRVDDLQTTVIAVLVGLVVTVSPAALLLLAR